MTLTLVLILLVTAFAVTILSAIDRCPLWIPVILICIALLIGRIPVG